MSASFEKVNYSIRPNKSVARKLVIDALVQLGRGFDFSRYRFIGLGSMWFVDFVLAHKRLRIADMISIERDDPDRAEFNRPYSCIRVEPGDTGPIFASDKLNLGAKEAIIWLDYDGILDSSVLADMRNVCVTVKEGSVILVAINAHKNSYFVKRDKAELTLEESMKLHVGSLMPNPPPKDWDQQSNFVALVARIMFDHLKRMVRDARKGLTFIPLFNFLYRDGPPIVTVGGMLCNPEQAKQVTAWLKSSPGEFVSQEHQYRIDVPPLTIKEKHALDKLHPAENPLTPGELNKALRFSLKDQQLIDYHKFYRFYPVFGEIHS
jgi:putative O-methyltransferase